MSDKFHERFDISYGIDEARRRFVNRVSNDIFNGLLIRDFHDDMYDIFNAIASAHGEKHSAVRRFNYYEHEFHHYVQDDFQKVLLSLEAIYEYLISSKKDFSLLDIEINKALSRSEVDLGVRWNDGIFIKSGAELLDEALVNESLNWLRDKEYENVLVPYEKGLSYLLHSETNPDLLSDVVTDMYEALEALAKTITGKNKDLSANKDLFLKNVKASESYKNILKEYINYANDFRHAVETGSPKPALSYGEVESFLYLTGVFIRLATYTYP